MMKRYEIWDAHVRFEDSQEIKTRPVLIWGEYAFIIAYIITGTDRGDTKDEFRIGYWKEAGLDKPTTIRIGKQLQLRKDDLIQRRGRLDPRDILRFDLRIAG
ncbi:MAG: hypothetical protein K6E81_03385 [Lachnospiraceae bacterium]|nr:hypothetical protein [Lachnospiraceae bacterium]